MCQKVVERETAYFDHVPISKKERDRLGHTAVAEELERAVLDPKTTTIGLFGDWGTGKSGVIELLLDKLRSEKNLTPIVFDAWAHSSEPLKRQLLVAIAQHVAPNQVVDLKTRLYEEYEKPVKPEITNVFISMGLLALSFLVVGLLIASVVVVLSVWSMGEAWQWQVFWTDFGDSVVGGIAPLGMLAVIGAWAMELLKGTPWGKRTCPRVAEERLDEELAKLVKVANNQEAFRPMVIVVDELDRCTPRRVVETLELLRQFLESTGIVTVVAADHRYLSKALADKVVITKEEPLAEVEEYLDKVFQRQICLPPIHPVSLTKFTLEIVQQKNEFWGEIPELENLISILIPSTVQTPRRVKTLLNGFVTQFRLAEKRLGSECAHESLLRRAPELAKLCTIKAEFPAFYEYLSVTGRAAALVREVVKEGELSQTVIDEARHYPGLESFLRRLSDSVGNLQNGVGPKNAEEGQFQGLARYVSRTDDVSVGSHDLLYLEVPHEVFGLEPSVAENVYSFALDNQVAAIASLVGDDPVQLDSAVRYIASRLNEAIGKELANAVKSALELLSYSNAVPDEKTAALLDGSIGAARRLGSITPYSAPGRILCAGALGRIGDVRKILGDPAIVAERDSELEVKVIRAAFAASSAADSLDKDVEQFFFDTDPNVLDHLVEADPVIAEALATLLLEDPERLALRFKLPESEEEPVEAADSILAEFASLVQLGPNTGLDWQIAELAVRPELEGFADEWAKVAPETIVIAPGVGATVMRLLGALDPESWDAVLRTFKKDSLEVSDFEALSTLAIQAAEDSDHIDRLWHAMLESLRMPQDAQLADDLGVVLSDASSSEDIDVALAAYGRLVELAKVHPQEQVLDRLAGSTGTLIGRIEGMDEDTWQIAVEAIRDESLTGQMSRSSIQALSAAVVGNTALPASERTSIVLALHEYLGERPTVSSEEIGRIAESSSTTDQDSLKRLLKLRPTSGDLQVIALSLRRRGLPGFGPYRDAFFAAVQELSSDEAAGLLEILLDNEWPEDPSSQSVFFAHQGVAEDFIWRMLSVYSEQTVFGTRKYAVHVLSTAESMLETPATRLANAFAKKIRAGLAQDTRLACRNIELVVGASKSSRENLRRALSGARKTVRGRDLRRIERVLPALTS